MHKHAGKEWIVFFLYCANCVQRNAIMSTASCISTPAFVGIRSFAWTLFQHIPTYSKHLSTTLSRPTFPFGTWVSRRPYASQIGLGYLSFWSAPPVCSSLFESRNIYDEDSNVCLSLCLRKVFFSKNSRAGCEILLETNLNYPKGCLVKTFWV